MRTTLFLATTLALSPIQSPAAASQEGEAALQQAEELSEGLRLLRAADQALRSASAFSFTVTREGVGAQATREPRTAAHVVVSRASKASRAGLFEASGTPQWHVAAFGSNASADGQKPGVPFAITINADQARTLSDAVIVESSAEHAQELVELSGAATALQWLLEWETLVGQPVVDGVPRVQPRLDDRVLIDQEPTDAVYVDLAEFPGTYAFGAWWYLGVDDHLPRRLELVYYDVRNADNISVGDGISRLTITDIVPLASPAETAGAVALAASLVDGANWGQPGTAPFSESFDAANPFALPTPEGFEVEQFEPQADQQQAAGMVEPPVDVPAPDFTLLDADGAEHTLSDYQGKIVILDFWATWCHPCLMVMPQLQAIHERFKNQDVVVMGINAWENGDPKALMDERGWDYLLLLKGDQVAADYGVGSIPTMVVIDQTGRIVQRKVGAGPTVKADLIETITRLRGEN
ncbi:MAG: TlpA family protein disulfide reductase [Phycisphaerales bacterium JB060]